MKRKLLLINAMLFGLFVLGASELYSRWLEADARFARIDQAERVVPLPEYPAPGAQAAVRPAEYMPVVDRMLFSKDRNPVVEVVVAEAPVEQRPDLPLLAGLADFGDGPRALMAAASNDTPQWIKTGDKVGAFVFEGLDGQKVKLSWKGEPFTVSQDQLAGSIVRKETKKQQAKGPARNGAAPAAPAQTSGNLAAQQAPETVGGAHNIGKELRPGVFAADPKDNSPDGTSFKHSDGGTYVKTVRRTPFGSQSWWEKKAQ
ncbi:MAG: hypothetical protein R2724_26210 [Bryobacterales bacterium]